jgi:hypothetical protein
MSLLDIFRHLSPTTQSARALRQRHIGWLTHKDGKQVAFLREVYVPRSKYWPNDCQAKGKR